MADPDSGPSRTEHDAVGQRAAVRAHRTAG